MNATAVNDPRYRVCETLLNSVRTVISLTEDPTERMEAVRFEKTVAARMDKLKSTKKIQKAMADGNSDASAERPGDSGSES
jgi:hypothetical protein